MALWSCFALAVFAVALLVLTPAGAIGRTVTLPPQIEAISGRLWQGTARIAGGHLLEWSAAGIGLDLRLTGPGTLLTGRLEARLLARSLAATDIDGRAGAAILAIAPGLAGLTCDVSAIARGVGLSYGRASASATGLIDVPAGTCIRREMVAPIPAIAFVLGADGDAATLAAATPEGAALGAARLSPRRLVLRMEPAGAALVPGLPSGGPIAIEREIMPPRWLP